MEKFSSHSGIAVPLLVDDLNTDQIAPVQAMRDLKPDYRKLLFMRTRSEDPNFVLNKRRIDDKDHYSNKRLKLAGDLMEDLSIVL